MKLTNSWTPFLKKEFSKKYFKALENFLEQEHSKGRQILPPEGEIFRAFDLCSWDSVRVVIIGQDPYHGQGQANGLGFSVRSGVKTPPSLRNIYKEINTDLGIEIPTHGNLESWAKQGVLLINATLTVEFENAGSHQKKGWEQFTDEVVKILNEKKEKLVFILWGNFAKKKALDLIDSSKHCVLTAAHPSPLAASRGFFGCRHFSKTNEYLKACGLQEIDWKIS